VPRWAVSSWKERIFLFQEHGPDGPCACKTEISRNVLYVAVNSTSLQSISGYIAPLRTL